jgi:hypothetical protein
MLTVVTSGKENEIYKQFADKNSVANSWQGFSARSTKKFC